MRSWLCSVLVLCCACSAAWGQAITLTTVGKSDYIIVVPDKAAAPQATAAKELQEHLAKATGATLKIVPESEAAAAAPQIVIGPSARMKQLLPDVDVNAFGHDGILLKTVGQNLVLAGRPPRGALYAVYTFLEDVVGCRWWTSTESFVPQKPTLTIPAQDVQYAPKLLYREAFYRDALSSGVFAARCKCNGQHDHAAPEYGDHYTFSAPGFVHTFYPLLPPAKYFDKHPEWYSEINGKRTHNHAQLCLTNEEMRKELVRNALEKLRKSSGAGFISISQNDCHGACQCAKCKAVDQEEGSPAGTLLRFVNAVAADIEKEFPDVLVETLAYQYTRKPPKITRPRANVVVRLCSIECSFAQPLEDPMNTTFRQDIEGWSKIAPKLFIWDYVTNFSNYLLPHPNYHILAPNIRFFVKNNTIGLFEQGDCGSSIGDFVLLRAWVISHLLWNPELDQKALTQDFMQGYYGAAAPYLSGYREMIDNAGGRSGKFIRCYMNTTAPWLSIEQLNKATQLFAQAQQAVANDPVLAKRVQHARLSLDYARLGRFFEMRHAGKQQQIVFPGDQDPQAACEAFIRQAESFAVGQYAEGRPFGPHAKVLRDRFRPACPPPKLCVKLSRSEWIDLQDNEFRYHSLGNLCTKADDSHASDGKAARMPGDHYEWAVSCTLSDDYLKPGPWRCYAEVRCEATAKKGQAIKAGIYDAQGRRNVAYKELSVAEAAGPEYRLVDLGVHDLTGTMYIWFAPPKRPGEVQAVYIDRVFLIREHK